MKIFGKSGGFTLIEILIAVSIFSAIMLGLSFFVLDVVNFEIFFSESLNSEFEAQLALQVIISELRSISYASTGSYPIDSASASSLTFFSDTDNDGYTEKIRYFTDGGILKKGIIKPSGLPLIYDPNNEKITEAVRYLTSGNIFSYFGENYDGSQAFLGYPIDLSLIKLVKVELKIDKNPNSLPLEIILPIYVNIRNLRGK